MTSTFERKQKATISQRRAAAIRLKNNRLGMNIFQVSWIMAFVAMVIVNWQLRFSYSQWPPLGVAAFDPLLPSIATITLLFSSLAARRGLRCIRGGDRPGFMGQWRMAMALGGSFVIIIMSEFINVSAAALATQYGVTFRLMTGFHCVHALAILLMMLRVYRRAAGGAYRGGEVDSWAVEGTARLWYFVTFAWMLFYVVLYWIR